MKRTLLQVLCLFLLLVAQQVALTHSVWHLHDFFPAQGAWQARDSRGDGDDEHSSQSRFCNLHFALGTVLAGDQASQVAVLPPASAHWQPPCVKSQRVAQQHVSFHSRAPPVRS